MPNPLLEMTGLPPFPAILPEHVEPAIDTVLAENRAAVAALLARGGGYTWENLMAPLEALEDRLNRVWSPVGHMNSVVNTEPLRAAYNACLPKISGYQTELGQNEALYRACQSIADSSDYAQLAPGQRRLLDNALRDFRLSGVALPPAQKERFKAIQEELARLTSQFGDNVLDATNAFRLNLTDEARIAGIPETSLAMLRQNADRIRRERAQSAPAPAPPLPPGEGRGEGAEGGAPQEWVVTLEFPSYYAVMTHADDRALRREVYEAYTTRASDRGPHAGRFDNGPLMEQILALRHEQAQLLGFANYAERSLATKMAHSTDQVMGFLHDLGQRSLALAQSELEELRAFARAQGCDDLQAWDISYYGDKLRQAKHAVSQEMLRPYFPAERAVSGMFEVVRRLFGIEIRPVEGVPVWHPDVRFFDIYDNQDQLRGRFYLDLYARPHKRGGAWMDDCIGRRKFDAGVQTPVAYLTCNFTPRVGDQPALLTHDEVTTLFHEFGHGLQHMLTRVDWLGVSGINGIPWDAVELPSQFLENWCWEREALDLISGHYLNGEPIPEDLFRKLLAARNFQSGMQMVRQLEFALFDFRIHREYDPAEGGRVQQILDEVRAEVAVVHPPEYNRFQHGFNHIFAGGYAAGYYSYKWAEVLSADAFSRFEEEGIFNGATGAAFMEAILEQGGAREPMELFIQFRGRQPQIDALLRHSGIGA